MTLSDAHPGPPTVTCQLRLTINGSNGVLFLILRLVQWSGAANEFHPAALKSVVTDIADFGGEDPPPPLRTHAPKRQSTHAPTLAPALGIYVHM